jgi:hypothetical protein
VKVENNDEESEVSGTSGDVAPVKEEKPDVVSLELKIFEKVQKQLSKGMHIGSDSEEDILEIVDAPRESPSDSNNKGLRVPKRLNKHMEILRLAQEQAKIRRQKDEEELEFLISEQKRKKAARKAAARKGNNDAAEEADTEEQPSETGESQGLKRLVKVIYIFMHQCRVVISTDVLESGYQS